MQKHGRRVEFKCPGCRMVWESRRYADLVGKHLPSCEKAEKEAMPICVLEDCGAPAPQRYHRRGQEQRVSRKSGATRRAAHKREREPTSADERPTSARSSPRKKVASVVVVPAAEAAKKLAAVVTRGARPKSSGAKAGDPRAPSCDAAEVVDKRVVEKKRSVVTGGEEPLPGSSGFQARRSPRKPLMTIRRRPNTREDSSSSSESEWEVDLTMSPPPLATPRGESGSADSSAERGNGGSTLSVADLERAFQALSTVDKDVFLRLIREETSDQDTQTQSDVSDSAVQAQPSCATVEVQAVAETRSARLQAYVPPQLVMDCTQEQ